MPALPTRPRRSASGLLAAALSAGLALPALPALAEDPQAPQVRSPLLLATGTDSATRDAGIFRLSSSGGASSLDLLVPDDTGRLTRSLAASRTGDRFVSLERVRPTSQGGAVERVAVRDVSGLEVGVADQLPVVSGPFTTDARLTELSGRPALAPSGDAVAWVRQGYASCSTPGRSELRLAGATGAGARVLSALPGGVTGTGFSDVAFYDEDLVVAGVGGQIDPLPDTCFLPLQADSYVTVDRAGATAAVTGWVMDPSTTVAEPAFSADGTRVVYTRTSRDRSMPDTVETAPVTRAGGSLTIGTPVLLGPGRSPSLSPDGTTVLLVRDGRPVTVPVGGGAAVPQGPSSLQVGFAAYATREQVAPAAPLSVTAGPRAGTAAVVGFTLAPDATASTVFVTRTTPGLPDLLRTVTLASGAVTTGSVRIPGLVSGRSYDVSVSVHDRSGNLGAVRTVSLPATAPASAVATTGGGLRAGGQLRTDTGHRLRLGADGNLVAYAPNGTVLFQTRTRGTGAVLTMGGDGNLVLRDGARRVLWQTRTAGQLSSVLVVQRDGNVVLYRDSDGQAVWSSVRGRLY